jgi:hypothetical protein
MNSSCSRSIPLSQTGNISTYPDYDPQFYKGTTAGARSYASYLDQRALQATHAAPALPPVKQFQAPTTCNRADPWSDNNPSQCDKLNLNRLMPQSWQSNAAKVLDDQDDPDSWSRYTVTKDDYLRYTSAAGMARAMEIDQSAQGRITGNQMGIYAFASIPQPALTLGPDSVIFNDSSARQALVMPRARNFFGCGQ